jgi:hypothetical protein
VTSAHLAPVRPDGQPERQSTSYTPVDLSEVDVAQVEPPSILYRTDRTPLLYAGRVSWFSGEAETAKGWILTAAAVEVLAVGGRVAWVDLEDTERTLIERLTAMAVDRDVINDPARLRYVRPAEPLFDRQEKWTAAGADFNALLDWEPDLAVIDGVTEYMQVEGLDPNSGPDVASWLRRIPRRLAGVGAAVPCIDHVVKDREGRGRYAIGSVHKLNGVDGAAFIVEAVERFGRATGPDPVEGMSRILLAKDRPGWLRGRVGKDQPVADARFTAWPDGGVTVHLEPPGRGAIGEHERRIADHLTIYDGASKKALRELGNSGAVDGALTTMIAAGWVTVTKSGNVHQHSLTDAGRDHFRSDDHGGHDVGLVPNGSKAIGTDDQGGHDAF